MRRFFCPILPGKDEPPVGVDPQVSHHVLRVVGIAPHERVELFDGQGRGCIASLAKVEAGQAFFLFENIVKARQPAQELCLLVGLLRQQAFSTVIRMCCEIGVSRLIPVACARSVARGNKQARWQKIADAAAGQSGRTKTLQVSSLLSVSQGLKSIDQHFHKVLLHPGGVSLRPTSQPCALFIGPEGGFTKDEVHLATSFEWMIGGLGNLTLRADTAAVVAAGLMLVGN